MKLFKFQNLKEYKKIQQNKASKQLFHQDGEMYHWVTEKEAEMIAKHFLQNSSKKELGICHGSKIGYEVNLFRKLLNFNIIGTDIGDFANKYPNMIQHDFHDVKAEWVDNVDFIYTNSLDHSYDPLKALNTWRESLHKDGIMYIEWSSYHNVVNQTDCFGAELDEYKKLIKDANMNISTIIHVPENKNEFYKTERFVLACSK